MHELVRAGPLTEVSVHRFSIKNFLVGWVFEGLNLLFTLNMTHRVGIATKMSQSAWLDIFIESSSYGLD